MNSMYTVPASKMIDVIIVTDAKNEADDQYATKAKISRKLLQQHASAIVL